VVVHPDHDDAGLRRDLRELCDRVEAHVAQHRLLDEDHGGPQPAEQPDHVGKICGRGKRLDAGLALEQLPQGGAHALVPGGDEDGDRCGLCLGCELGNHLTLRIVRRRPLTIGVRG